MSTSGIKLLCETVLGFDSQNQPAYLTEYKCSTPVQTPSGPHFGAGIVTLLNGLTETPFNAVVAQAVADKANLETSGIENFSENDVFGGEDSTMPSNNNARVFARLLDWSDPSPSVAGQLRVRIEYSLLDGTRSDGKFTLVTPLTNSKHLNQDLTDGLVAFLNAQTPTPSPLYRERDVVLWGG